MGAFDSFSQEAKSRRAAEVKATQLRNKKRFQTKPTTKPIYGASRHYLDRDWDGESLGQVYIGNKGWVGITPSGRVGYKNANGYYTPIKNLTDYDKQQIALAVNKTGVKALTGDRSREVANAWSKNSGTWLATKQRIAKPNVAKPQVTKKSSSSTVSTDKPNTRTPPVTSRPRTTLATKTSASNSWINKSRGIWNYNGVSQADVANAYKTGDFSKVGSYLSQHKDLASYLNNVYSKRGGNQFNQSTQTQQTAPIKGTPGYGIHVGNGSVTLSTPNSSTTDITNSHNVSTLINNGNYKAPNLGNTATNYLENRPLDSYSELTKHNFDRGDIRQSMRANGINPYDYSGSDRKQLRTYLNNPTTDNYTQSVSKIIGDGKIQQNMLNNTVQNQTSQYQLTKPNLGYTSQNNQLVNLKFKKGGQMYKYAAGAQMVQPQQTSGQQGIEQQAMALVQAAMQGDQKANQTIQKIMQAAQQGDQQAAQVAQLLKNIVQQMKGSRKARLGAKLDYIKQSIGECPEGQEVVYFKKGGEICKVCAGKKMQNGGKSDPIKDFKKKKDVTKQTYQRNPYTRGKSAKEIAEMQRRNRQEAGAGKGENDANVAPWNYKKKR